MWSRRHAVLGLLSAGLFAACVSPTLPLPPPDDPDFSTEAAPGVWQIRGSCLPGAQITLLNESTGRGVVFLDQSRAGRYNVEIEATECDVIAVSQERDGEGSATAGFVVTEVDRGLVVDPTACSN